MQTRPQPLSITVLRPPLLALAFIFKIIHKVFFAWWLDPWLQRKSNQALWDDVQLNLYLLYSKGELIKEKRPQILPFDYASVSLVFGNIRFIFTRGREELNVSLSPRHAPMDTHQLPVVIAAVDSRDVTEQKPIAYLSEVGDLLGPRLGAPNRAFSEKAYPDFKRKLEQAEKTLHLLTREFEWELNKRLYPWKR